MLHRRSGGSRGLGLLITLVLAAATLHAAVADEILDALRGRWAPAPGAAATMEWQPDGAGFTVTWGNPAPEPVSARFEPSGRPGIYAGRDAAEWSMFGSADPVNPLAEGTLLWARTTPDAAYVYRMAVDDHGGFVLERFTCRPSADTLSVAMLRWTANGPEPATEQKLVRLDR